MKTTRRLFLRRSAGVAIGAAAIPQLLRSQATRVRAQVLPGALNFRGAAGKTIVGPVTLNPGVTVLRAQHNGTSNFGATLFLPTAGETPQQSYTAGDYSGSFLVFNLVGAFKSSGLALVTMQGDHYINVDASGAWQISVEQPLPENVTPVQQTTFTGKGQDVTPYFTLPVTISSITVTTASNSLRAWLYHLDDLGGEPVAAGLQDYDGRIFDFTFPGNQTSFPLTLPDTGPYIVAVDNTLENTDAWTIAFA